MPVYQKQVHFHRPAHNPNRSRLHHRCLMKEDVGSYIFIPFQLVPLGPLPLIESEPYLDWIGLDLCLDLLRVKLGRSTSSIHQ